MNTGFAEDRDLPQLRAWDPWQRKIAYQQAVVVEDDNIGEVVYRKLL